MCWQIVEGQRVEGQNVERQNDEWRDFRKKVSTNKMQKPNKPGEIIYAGDNDSFRQWTGVDLNTAEAVFPTRHLEVNQDRNENMREKIEAKMVENC